MLFWRCKTHVLWGSPRPLLDPESHPLRFNGLCPKVKNVETCYEKINSSIHSWPLNNSLCLYSNKVFCWLCYSASTLLVSNPTLKKRENPWFFQLSESTSLPDFHGEITLDFNTDALATAQMKINDFEKQHTEGNWVNIKLETLYFVCVTPIW